MSLSDYSAASPKLGIFAATQTDACSSSDEMSEWFYGVRLVSLPPFLTGQIILYFFLPSRSTEFTQAHKER